MISTRLFASTQELHEEQGQIEYLIQSKKSFLNAVSWLSDAELQEKLIQCIRETNYNFVKLFYEAGFPGSLPLLHVNENYSEYNKSLNELAIQTKEMAFLVLVRKYANQATLDNALAIAIKHEYADGIDYFLRESADPNTLMNLTEGCLLYAAKTNNLELVKLLLTKGARIEDAIAQAFAQNENGYEHIVRFLLNYAMVNGVDFSKEDFAKFFGKINLDNANFMGVSVEGHPVNYFSFLSFRSDILAPSLILNELDYSKIKDHAERTAFILRINEAVNNRGMLPIFENGNVSLDLTSIETAIKYERIAAINARLSARQKLGLKTCLMDNMKIALRFGLEHIADAFLAQMDLDQRDEKGYTLLHNMAQENREFGVRYLIEKGADVNALDNNGHTPLWHLQASIPPTAKLLLEKNAVLDAKYIESKKSTLGKQDEKSA